METAYGKHRGLTVEQVLNENGIDLSSLSKMIDLNEEHINVLLGDHFLDYDIINFIGHHIGHDFSQEFPEMQKQSFNTVEPTK